MDREITEDGAAGSAGAKTASAVRGLLMTFLLLAALCGRAIGQQEPSTEEVIL